MYTPAHYHTDDQALMERLILENQFATLIVPRTGESSMPKEPSISHLPLLLMTDAKGGKLIGHMARANPQWRDFPKQIVAIFNGPHGYISPAWYDDQPDNVPTWNYVAAHVRGEARVLEDPHEALAKLVLENEKHYGTGWSLSRNNDIEKLAKAIVAFEIVDLKFEGKLKLSQKIEPQERARVIAGLETLGNPELAEWMRLTTPPQKTDQT